MGKSLKHECCVCEPAQIHVVLWLDPYGACISLTGGWQAVGAGFSPAVNVGQREEAGGSGVREQLEATLSVLNAPHTCDVHKEMEAIHQKVPKERPL